MWLVTCVLEWNGEAQYPFHRRAAVSSWWELQPSRPNHPGGRTQQNMPAVAAPHRDNCMQIWHAACSLSHTRGKGGNFLLSWGIQAWNILKTRFYNFTYPLECGWYGWIVEYFETVLLLSKPIANQFEQHTTEQRERLLLVSRNCSMSTVERSPVTELRPQPRMKRNSTPAWFKFNQISLFAPSAWMESDPHYWRSSKYCPTEQRSQ